MSLIQVEKEDTWLKEYEYFGILLSEINQATVRRRQLGFGNPQFSMLTTELRKKIPQAELQLATLINGVEDPKTITYQSLLSAERDRRRRLCYNLQSSLQKASQEFYSGFSRQGPFMKVADLGSVNWGEHENEVLNNLSNAELRSQQQQMAEEEENMLESLSKVVQNQKRISKAINSEVEDQDDLLIDIKTRVDENQTGLDQQTGNITETTRKSSTCGYWLVILILMIAIIIVAVW